MSINRESLEYGTTRTPTENDPVTIERGSVQLSKHVISVGYSIAVMQEGLRISSVGSTIRYAPDYPDTSIGWFEPPDVSDMTELAGSLTDMRAPNTPYNATVSVYVWIKGYPDGSTQGFHRDFTIPV